MKQEIQNTGLQIKDDLIYCAACGRLWQAALAEGLKPGDPCPSDDCPSHESNPLGLVSAVCREHEGNGIFSVGAIAALKAMAHHWEDHLAEGHSPKIIGRDIEEMIQQMQTMRLEIMRRLGDTGAGDVCQKCGSHLKNGWCSDHTCPYSDWPQSVPLATIEAEPPADLKRVRVSAEVHDDNHQFSVEFDAAPWFAQASDDQIIDLHAICWSNDYAADEVAEFFEAENEDIASCLNFCRASKGRRNSVGFECAVNEADAMAWLKQNRTGLWARFVCEEHGVMLTERGENFGWNDAKENTSADGFASKQLAALNAVKVLNLT